MLYQSQVIDDKDLVEEHLAKLKLSLDVLRHAVEVGQAERNTATPHDPANAGGTLAYFGVVRTLRDQLVPQGWIPKSTANFALVAERELGVAIAASGGDKDTGQREGKPRTRNPKGNQTAQAINTNQMSLWPQEEAVSHDEDVGQIWFLLYHPDAHEVRMELSLPTTMDDQGRVNGWSTRLILDPIPLDPLAPVTDYDFGPAVTVDIRKRNL